MVSRCFHKSDSKPHTAFPLHETTPQPVAKVLSVKQLRGIRKCVNMLLKLARRHQKQEHQMDWITVERVELNSLSGAPNYCHYFGHQFRRGVGDAYAKPDSCAHPRLAPSNAP